MTHETPTPPQKPTLAQRGKKAVEIADRAATTAETASNAFGAVKWTAIAIVTLTIAGLGFGLYKIIAAPAKAVGNAAGAVSDGVKSGAGKIKSGGSSVINRLDIAIADQPVFDMESTAAFMALSSIMEPTEPEGMKDTLYRAKNFPGAEGRICKFKIDFGGGPLPVALAADNEGYAKFAALASLEGRLIRIIMTAGDDDIALTNEWDDTEKKWVLKWKATTIKKPLSDDLAQARTLDILQEAAIHCR